MSELLPDLIAAAMLVALVLYAVLGGADFGGGFWDLFAAGPRAKEQRETIEHSIAPVWEANHVWLILIVVLLFTAFPPAFSEASIVLHLPLTAMLLGVVLRGSAFVFRKYDVPGPSSRAWSRAFAAGSVIAPFFLGVCFAAISGGRVIHPWTYGAGYTDVYLWPWLGTFPVLVGLLTLALFAFVAAVYLTVEAQTKELQDDFRRRAFVSGGVAALLAALAAADTALEGPTGLSARLMREPGFLAILACAAATAVALSHALATREFRRARMFTVLLVAIFLGGWAFGQYPYLIAPRVTIHDAAAPEATLRLVAIALAAGALVLVPSLYALFRVFKPAKRSLPPQLDPNHQP